MDFAKKSFSIFKIDVGVHGITYILRIIIAGILGPMNFGIFSLIHLIPEYCEKLLRFSVDDASIYISGKKKYELGEVFFNSAFLMFCLSFLPFILFLWQGEIFYKYFLKDPSINRIWIWIALASVPFIFLFRSVVKLLLFLEKVSLYNNLNLFISLSGYLLGIVLISIFEADVLGILFAITFGYFVGSLLGIYSILKIVQPKPNLKFSLLKELFVYGTKIQIPNTFFYLHLRIDMLIVAFFLTAKEVGYYALAVSIAEVLRKIPFAMISILYPRTSKLSNEEAKVLTAKSCRNTFVILCFLSVPFYFLVNTVIMPILGKDFSPIIYPFLALIPGIIALSVGQLLMIHFYGRGYPLTTLKLVMIGLVVNVLLNFWLIPKIGILGAALASSISYVLLSILLIKTFENKEMVSTKEILLPSKEDFKFYNKFLRVEIYEKFRKAFAISR